MFKARELYYNTGQIPKIQIQKWSELRIIKILILSVAIFFFLMSMIPLVTDWHIASYNLLEQPLENDGLFNL